MTHPVTLPDILTLKEHNSEVNSSGHCEANVTNEVIYTLQCVINHHSDSRNRGHYTCDTLDPQGNIIRFNDANVSYFFLLQYYFLGNRDYNPASLLQVLNLPIISMPCFSFLQVEVGKYFKFQETEAYVLFYVKNPLKVPPSKNELTTTEATDINNVSLLESVASITITPDSFEISHPTTTQFHQVVGKRCKKPSVTKRSSLSLSLNSNKKHLTVNQVGKTAVVKPKENESKLQNLPQVLVEDDVELLRELPPTPTIYYSNAADRENHCDSMPETEPEQCSMYL